MGMATAQRQPIGVAVAVAAILFWVVVLVALLPAVESQRLNRPPEQKVKTALRRQTVAVENRLRQPAKPRHSVSPMKPTQHRPTVSWAAQQI